MATMRSVIAASFFALGVGVLAGCGGSTTATGHSSLPTPLRITARFTAKSLGLRNPRSLAIGPDGNLYVTDASQRVSVISPGGHVLRRWGRLGSGRGEFRFVAGNEDPNDIDGKVAVGGPDAAVYVSDGGNGRVQVFTPQGHFVSQFGSFGEGEAQFLDPRGLAVDHEGNVYVVDDTRATLSKFAPGGKLVWRVGGATSSDRDLGGHLQLMGSIDRHDRLVIANDARGRIVYVDAGGHAVDSFGAPTRRLASSWACGATVDAQGNTFVFECFPRHLMRVFDRTHRLIARWSTATFGPPQFGPHGEIFALYEGRGADVVRGILKLAVTRPSS